MRALGVARLEVALREAQGGELVKRSWSAQELEQSVAWLKRMNARGHDVFIRPEGGHGLVLVDGLPREALASMAKEGFTPAATIEAGPGHFQAWVKLSDGPLPAEVHDQAAHAGPALRGHAGEGQQPRLGAAGGLHAPGAGAAAGGPATLRAGVVVLFRKNGAPQR